MLKNIIVIIVLVCYELKLVDFVLSVVFKLKAECMFETDIRLFTLIFLLFRVIGVGLFLEIKEYVYCIINNWTWSENLFKFAV